MSPHTEGRKKGTKREQKRDKAMWRSRQEVRMKLKEKVWVPYERIEDEDEDWIVEARIQGAEEQQQPDAVDEEQQQPNADEEVQPGVAQVERLSTLQERLADDDEEEQPANDEEEEQRLGAVQEEEQGADGEQPGIGPEEELAATEDEQPVVAQGEQPVAEEGQGRIYDVPLIQTRKPLFE